MTEYLENGPSRVGCCGITHVDAVATIMMDRPKRIDAASRRFWCDLRNALDLLEGDGRTQVVIITGASEQPAGVGNEIAELSASSDMEDVRFFLADAMECFARIEASPLFIIAAVNGIAPGGDFEIALASDVAMAATDMSFGMPQASIDFVPGYAVVRAPEIIGRKMTKYLLASAYRLPAARAREIGLVEFVFPRDQLLAEARDLARRISVNASPAISMGKRLVNAKVDRL